MTYKMFSEAKQSQAGQGKKRTKYNYKILLLKHIVRFGIWKNFIIKLFIEMFIKETKAIKAHAYQMLLSFKTFVTYTKTF